MPSHESESAAIRLRAPVPEDAPGVHSVIAARDLSDLGVVDFTLRDLRDEWRSDEFDLAADAVLAERGDGLVVGYAILRRPGILAAVDPHHEGQGVGARLLEWAESRERNQGRDVHRQWITAANTSAQELLRAAGYELARSYFRMARRLDQVDPAPPPPPGFSRRRLDPEGDAIALHALDDASFSTTADYTPESLTSFREDHLRAHGVDPALSCVAESDGSAAGFLLARRGPQPGVGFVDILAVAPEHQRRGLGRTLLLGAFERFAAAGLREAQLGVASDNPRALALYRSAGMRPRFRFDVLERPVRSR